MKKFIISLIVVLFAAFSVKANEENTVVFIGTELAAMDGDEGELYEVINAASLNVRSGPSTNIKVIGKLEKGDIISVISFVGNWARFTLDGKTAYVSKAYLQKVMEQKVEKEVVETVVEEVKKEDTNVQTQEEQVYVPFQKTKKDIISGVYATVLTVFKKGVVFGVSHEQSFYNGLHYETGVKTNFRKTHKLSVNIGAGGCLGLYKNDDVCVVLVIPAILQMRDGVKLERLDEHYKPVYEDKLFLDFGFAPRLKARLGNIALSAGYYMHAEKFKFKKGYLGHSAILSLGYVFKYS